MLGCCNQSRPDDLRSHDLALAIPRRSQPRDPKLDHHRARTTKTRHELDRPQLPALPASANATGAVLSNNSHRDTRLAFVVDA